MKDPADADPSVAEGIAGPSLGEGSDSDYPLGFEDLDQPPQVRIAGRKE